MNRILVLCATVLMAHASSAQAQVSSITVQGQLAGNNFVNATCAVGNGGQVNGSGVLYGVNPANGYTYQYPFVITKATTAQGKLILTGNMTAGPPVTITSSVPNGPLVFSYVVNGKTYSLAGQGAVILK
jgi:hypothetical protein